MKEISITAPFDGHVHLRQGSLLRIVAPISAMFFRHAVVMGNLPEPVSSVKQAEEYKKEILDACHNPVFDPLVALMLAQRTNTQTLRDMAGKGFNVLKLIPAATSTNSGQSVSLSQLKDYFRVLEVAQELGIALSGHWELNRDPQTNLPIPETEREKRAIPFLEEVVKNFPALKIVAEHITTREILGFVKSQGNNVAATITAHHLILTYEQVLCDGKVIDPLLYCKPVAKQIPDRLALVAAATSGDDRFFFGSDSAPHFLEKKHNTPPAAGIFSAPTALSVLAEVFEHEGALNNLERFASQNGRKFYGLPNPDETIQLVKTSWMPPQTFQAIPVFMGGRILKWFTQNMI